MKILWPISLMSPFKKVPLGDGIIIRKITEEELASFFGMKERELNEQGSLIKYKKSGYGRFHLGGILNHILSHTEALNSSNYILETDESHDVITYPFNMALKLLHIGKSGVFIGFASNKDQLFLLSNNPYHRNSNFNVIDRSNLVRFKNILSLLRTRQFDRTPFQMYLEAFSGDDSSIFIRFIKLMITMEMLYLKEDKELGFRLSLTAAKILHKYLKMDILKTYKVVKNLYDKRSKILHVGAHGIVDNNELNILGDIVRESLILYLNNPSIFNKESLNAICLS